MKKGDLKKMEILNTAEDLFCRKGYEQTSIQDILDCLKSSKGSFYHHFKSKESLLEDICKNRAERIYRAAECDASLSESAIHKLSTLLSGVIPFRDEKLPFLMMLLPIFRLPEGRLVRQYYSDALAAQFRQSVGRVIEAGNQSGELFCSDPENASPLILSVICLLWEKICDMIIRAEVNRTAPDLTECLRLIESTQVCITRFLSLPYGSISLIDLPALRLLTDQIHNHWKSTD